LEKVPHVKDLPPNYYLIVKKEGDKNMPKDLGFTNEEVYIKDIHKTGKSTCLIERRRDLMNVRTDAASFSEHKINPYTSAIQASSILFPEAEGLDTRFIIMYKVLRTILQPRIFSFSADELRSTFDSTFDVHHNYKITAFSIMTELAKIYKDKRLYGEFIDALCQTLDLENADFTEMPIQEKHPTGKRKKPETLFFFDLKLPNHPFSPIREYSDGTMMVVALLIAVLSKDMPHIPLLIEEPENCLHPKALKTLISYLQQKSSDIQIILTTHSTYLLNNVKAEDVIVARFADDGTSRLEKIENLKDLNRKLSRGFLGLGDLLYSDFENEREKPA